MSPSAVLDLGTNTFRLLIFRSNPARKLTRLRVERHTPRMGEGAAESGRISPASCKRGETVLRQYDAILRKERVAEVRAVATGIFRVAKNAGAVLQRLSRALSHPIRVISGKEEGRYTLSGRARSVRPVGLLLL
ncbi:MAG: hypothetical protein GXP58_02085 [Deltaproteobacteria bacterium]|nr:hypothetical protein [Deltaproteobacteria bacterium]